MNANRSLRGFKLMFLMTQVSQHIPHRSQLALLLLLSVIYF